MNREQFTLHSFKVLDRTHASWSEKVIIEDEDAHMVPMKIDGSSLPVHEDMHEAFKQLKAILYHNLGLDKAEVIANDPSLSQEQKDAFKVLQERMNAIREDELDSIKPTGVHFSGKNNELLKITCTRNGIAMNSTLINLHGEAHGFEDELCKIIDKIVDEAFQYITEKKSAQLTIPELA